MKIDLSQTIFYLDLKHVHKYGSAKFQPNPLFTSQQMAMEHAESVAKEKKKKKKKVCKPIGDPVGMRCPNNYYKHHQIQMLFVYMRSIIHHE